VVDLSQLWFFFCNDTATTEIYTRGFHPYYRVDLVIRAFAEIQQEFPRARLDLVGQGPLEIEMRQLVQQLELTDVNFAGVASRREIGRFYSEADIFINASSLDNMPVSILEAFASGTPVVSTAPEGMQYLIEHERTGLLSPPGDAHALALNALRLLRDPDLSFRISLNAYEESRSYGWAAVREQWLEVYRCLAWPRRELDRRAVMVA
jgi:glycosyltransferase involved in cell wall biosynthesis